MAYEKTNWQTGDIVTADKLNNAENGIASSAPLIVNLSRHRSDEEWEAIQSDVTYADIVAALEAGRTVKIGSFWYYDEYDSDEYDDSLNWNYLPEFHLSYGHPITKYEEFFDTEVHVTEIECHGDEVGDWQNNTTSYKYKPFYLKFLYSTEGIECLTDNSAREVYEALNSRYTPVMATYQYIGNTYYTLVGATANSTDIGDGVKEYTVNLMMAYIEDDGDIKKIKITGTQSDGDTNWSYTAIA